MTTDHETHLELYERATVPHPTSGRLDSLRDALDDVTSERAWSFEVTHWPAHVEKSPEKRSATEHVYERLLSWADDAGVSLDPAFQNRECYCWETGERYEALVLPVACLSIERDDEVLAVYPHQDETGVHTITDAIEGLRTGDLLESDPEQTTSTESTTPEQTLAQ